MKQKRKLFAELPLDLSEPEMTFISNREVTVEGSRGVLEYGDELIKVNTGSMTVAFFGRGLNLKCISDSSLVIGGTITNVEFRV